MRTRFLLWPVGLLVALVATAVAHETGVIRLSSKEVAPGGELGLRGEKLPKRATVQLELRGTLESFPLARVRTDTAGRFTASLVLPPEARAGSYTVVALAPDGEVTARAELVVVAAVPATMDHGAMENAPAAAQSPHPTAEMMKVAAGTTAGEWAVMLTLIATSLTGGLALLRAAGRRPV